MLRVQGLGLLLLPTFRTLEDQKKGPGWEGRGQRTQQLGTWV